MRKREEVHLVLMNLGSGISERRTAKVGGAREKLSTDKLLDI